MAETTYEDLRDNDQLISRELREQWIRADQKERALRQSYAELEQDEDLTEEAKSKRAQELYERQREPLETSRKQLRERLLKASRSAEEFSIPRPSGESLSSVDPTKLLLDAMESQRIVRMVEKRSDNPVFAGRGTSEFLRQEFQRGLEVGGVEGGSIVRGVLRAARELGVPTHDIVDSSRNDSHRQRLDEARHLMLAADSISTKVPLPPKALKQATRLGRTGSSSSADLNPCL